MRAGVQFDRWQIELQKAHVLHDQRIDPGLESLPDQLPGAFQLIVTENGVQRQQYAGVEAVRMANKALDIGERIACPGACAEIRPADIHGVCPVVDGFDAKIGVFRRGEEFQEGRTSHGWPLL